MGHCSSSIPISLVVLAAGLGRRFGGDKPLATIGNTGKPLMYFSMLDACRAGVRRLVLIVSREIEPAIQEQFLPLLPAGLDVTLIQQRNDELPGDCSVSSRTKPWGTGHALWCARKAVPAQSIVINADDYYGPMAMSQMVTHFENSSEWAMVSYRLGDTLSASGAVNRGLCELGGDSLLAVRECLGIEAGNGVIRGEVDGQALTLKPDTPVSMNIWGFGPDIFTRLEKGLSEFFRRWGSDGQAEYYIPTQVMASVEAGENRVRVYTGKEKWRGMTYREDLKRLAAHFTCEPGQT